MEKFSVVYYLDQHEKIYHQLLERSLYSLHENKDDDCDIHLVTGKGIEFSKNIKDQVDGIHRISLDHGYYTRNRAKGYWDINLPGDVLYVDVDTIFQKPIDHVWKNKTFGVAVARRNKVIRGAEFNAGVIFCRNNLLWKELYEANTHNSGQNFENYFSSLVREERWSLAVLSSLYNFTPDTKAQDVSEAYIVHYKGSQRKEWMLSR